MIKRPELLNSIRHALRNNPIVALLGPRQCGKTTIARQFVKASSAEFYDLENPEDLSRLSAPMFALQKHTGIVVIDEVQRKPELFEILRVLADKQETRSKFLLLGSASPNLVRGVSESLAGRIALIEMEGFSLKEVGSEKILNLWLRGGFPRSYLAASERVSFEWRNDFIKTFLERDIPQLGISIPSQALRRFWTMLAHYHGQIWNAADLARSMGTSEHTVRRYLDLLSDAFVVRQLQPWFENLGKRQVKAPKVFIRDSGILHELLSIRSLTDLRRHPKYGASWEGFALTQVASTIKADEVYFWATHAGAELDMLAFKRGKRYGFEFKCVDSPEVTRSMRIAIDDLHLDLLHIVYPGTRSYILDKKIRVVSLAALNKPLI